MGTMDLTVKVTNMSSDVSVADLNSLFSYCGTIDDIQLQRDGAQDQFAFVTFKQPYAFETALLLNDAIIKDRHVHVVPLRKNGIENASKSGEGQGALKRTGEEKETGKTGFEPTKAAISAAEKVTGQVGTAILSSECFSRGAQWVSDVLAKASKYAADLGNYKNRDQNSRKQK